MPAGLEVVANGLPTGQSTRGTWTTWTWRQDEPMASLPRDGESVQGAGVFVDDVVVPVGGGSTSFDADGDALDCWAPTGAPAGSPPLANNWIAEDAADAPPPVGVVVRASFDREPEVLDFLSGVFGPYPFTSADGIVDDDETLTFALENQTRPIYPPDSFGDPESADSLVVHELAHQWYGDSLSLLRWRDIWLNEGFASYAEWLWSEREGHASAQELFDAAYAEPADSAFWQLRIGDPRPDHLFDEPVYTRGAMTLHALRLEIGDADFFRLLPAWSALRSDANVTTAQFVALAEQISSQQLDSFFAAWLYTGTKPVLRGVRP